MKKTPVPLASRWPKLDHLLAHGLSRAGLLAVLLGMGTRAVSVAQTSAKSNWQAQLEVGGGAASGQRMPFWLRANQWGLVPLTTPYGTVRAGLRKPYARIDTAKSAHPRQLDWTMGALGVVNGAGESRLLLLDGYVKGRWKSIELAVGRWRQLTGLGDSTLSSGFVNGSGNALPIPKIQLATLGYLPLGFTKRFVAINAGYVHGWFTGAYVQGSYLHQKYLYLRLGKPTRRLKVYLGINHEVQWGGQADYLKGTSLAVDGKLPSSFRYYPRVVLGLRPSDSQTSDYANFDGTYWFGNGLGSEDAGLELTAQRGTWLLYHQHMYDDLSGLLGINIPDGLTGLSWHRSEHLSGGWLNRVVVEWLSSMSQSGSIFELASGYQGRDNYFNHSQYQQGWSYLGRTLGTPFIAPQGELQPLAQGARFFPNNRLKMLYVGANGPLSPRLAWTFRLSYSQNYGTYDNPYSSAYGQVSSLVSLRWQMPRLAHTQLTASLALDQGQLLPNTVGGFVCLLRNW